MSEENLSHSSEDEMASLSGDEPELTLDSAPEFEDMQGLSKEEKMLSVVQQEIARLEAGFDRHLLELRRRFRANHLKPLHLLRAALLRIIPRPTGNKDREAGRNFQSVAKTDVPNTYHGGGRKEGLQRARAIRFFPERDVPSTSRGLVPAIRSAYVPSPSGSMEIKVGDRHADDDDDSEWESDKHDNSSDDEKGAVKLRVRSMKGQAVAARRKKSLRLRRVARRQQRIRRRIRKTRTRKKSSSSTLPLVEEGSSSWETLESTEAEGDGSRRQPPISTRSEPFFHLTCSDRGGGGGSEDAGSVAATRKSFSESSGLRRRVATIDDEDHVIPSKRPRLDSSREEEEERKVGGVERSKSDAVIWRKRLEEVMARRSVSVGGRPHNFEQTSTAAPKDHQLFEAPSHQKPPSTPLKQKAPVTPEPEQEKKSETATELYASSFNVYQHGIVVAGEGQVAAVAESSLEPEAEKRKESGENSVRVEPASSYVGEEQQGKTGSATKPEGVSQDDKGLHHGSFTAFHHGVFVATRLSVESESGADADDEAARRKDDDREVTSSSVTQDDDDDEEEEERKPARKRKTTSAKKKKKATAKKTKVGKRRNIVEESESELTSEEDEVTSNDTWKDSLTTTTESSQSTFYPTDQPAAVRKPRPGPSTQRDTASALRIVYSNLPGEERVWSRDEAGNIQLAFLEARRSKKDKKSKPEEEGEDWTVEATKAAGGKRKGKSVTPRESGHAPGSSRKRKRSESSAEDMEGDSEATEPKRPLLDESRTEIGHCFFPGFWDFIGGDWINEIDDQ